MIRKFIFLVTIQLLLLQVFVLLSSKLNAQNNCPYEIFFDDYLTLFNVGLNDTIIKKVDVEESEEIIIYKVFLKNCKGESYVMVYDSDTNLKCEGNYINSLDTFAMYLNVYNAFGNHIDRRVYKFYLPLRHGNWKFYESGNIVNVNYNNGALIYPNKLRFEDVSEYEKKYNQIPTNIEVIY